MGFLRNRTGKNAVQTTGVVERVVVTESDNGTSNRFATGQRTYVTVAFSLEDGTTTMQEQRRMLGYGEIPAPGSRVAVSYRPGDPSSFEFTQTGPPDAGVPRGWSAGIFDAPDVGSKRARAVFGRRGFKDQEELFRTGRRMTATVIAREYGRRRSRGAHHWTFELEAQGERFEAQACAPSQGAPDVGDLIEIAVASDGTSVALDTDPRYDGPPARALVFRTPPEVAAQRPPAPAEWGTEQDLQQLMSQALGAMGSRDGGFVTFGLPATPAPAPAPVPVSVADDHVARLDALLAAGQITQAEYARLAAPSQH
jgi:hypothetical protein